jgi:diguanylate cyclase (GGDEF)-like protein
MWRLPRLGLMLVLVFVIGTVTAVANEIDDQLRKADELKSVNYSQFETILEELGKDPEILSEHQRQFLKYLNAWHTAYGGDYATAIPQLRQIIEQSDEPTLRFRALATIVNTLGIARRYEDAFSKLEDMLALLPQVTDPGARQQGLSVAAFLYSEVGLVDLTIKYSDQVTQENWAGRGLCRGGQVRLSAIYKSDRVTTIGPEMDEVIDACSRNGDRMRANLVRTDAANFLLRQGRYESAFLLLDRYRQEVLDARYPTLISIHDALLARAYREMGQPALVQKHATLAIENAIKGEYTESLVIAYRLLYLLARERGDIPAALEYHEKYAAADKGYLDELSARQLAYEKVKHQSLANELQIDTLNREKEVLELQQALDKKAVETSRLYIALLLLAAGFIAYFAYRTKRSQLHFMKLSQQDGLTGIANRPHFIERAETALDSNRKTHQEVCVVLCDLDHFKAINDRYGHATGDQVLRQVVTEFRRHLRANDIFGRVGGEEFGVLLPGCSLDAARERCEQLRRALGELTIRFEEHDIRASASFGIESTASCGYDLRQLLANADAALYQAKDAGRNCIKAYDSSMANTFTSMTTGRFRSSRDRFDQDFAAQTK